MPDEHREHPPGAGKSSFELIDPEALFRRLPLLSGMTFLDLGCGKGAYFVAISRSVGDNGVVHAIDLWEEGISLLRDRIAQEGYGNIRAAVADIGSTIPVEGSSVDACLMAAVLHDLVESDVARGALREVVRVLKPEGTLAIVEFKKIDGPPGPPVRIRLAPDEVERLVLPWGFVKTAFEEIGPYHYLLLFRRTRGAG